MSAGNWIISHIIHNDQDTEELLMVLLLLVQPVNDSLQGFRIIAIEVDGLLARVLQGDLEAVLFRAMALDPRVRYATASALRDDLRRRPTGRPVKARPPTSWS